MKILKVGTRFINVDAVARVDVIDIDEHEKIARVTMLSTAGVTNEHGSSVKSEVLSFCDEEAEIIANYFEALASQTTENP
jgi:predicted glycosyltransferase involved in capsule biosynthesis